MKFLVTGSTGQLGQEWIHFLDRKNLIFQAYSSNDLDITDQNKVKEVLESVRPDVVINCAAYTDVDGAESESNKAFLINETGVNNLSDACSSINATLIHYSTDYVFSGKREDRKKYPHGYPEEAETDPVNIYGKSKEAGEKVLMKSECSWLLIRVAWLCGRFDSNFVKTMLRLGEEQNRLKVVDDQFGCPSFAFDVVEKTYQLITKGKSGIYHVSCKGKITWADFADEIFRQTGLHTSVERISSDEYSFTANRPKFTLLSNRKAEKTGFDILHWKLGLERLLEQIGETSDLSLRNSNRE